MFEARVLTIFSSLSMTDKSEMSRFLMMDEIFLMNESSSLLFFTIENLDILMFSSTMKIKIVRVAWSEESHQSGWIKWLLSLEELLCRNIRSMTKLDLPTVSGGNLVSQNWQVQVKRVCNNNKIVTNRGVMRKRWIPNTVSNIKITSHNKKVWNICLRILAIL